MLFTIPPELLLRVLELVLDQSPRDPIPLLLVNSQFHRFCLLLLHAELRFTSIRQLDLFLKTCHTLVIRPRELHITLAGGTADFRLFKLFRDVLIRISTIATKSLVEQEVERKDHLQPALPSKRVLRLRRIQLCLNSHVVDANCPLLSEAVALTKILESPEEFIWTGPDPAHHFSLAIVPIAAMYLFKTMHGWSNLRHLKLTNLAFPQHLQEAPKYPLAEALGVSIVKGSFGRTVASEDTDTSNMKNVTTPSMPYLQSIYLGQVTFLKPSEVVLIACSSELTSLTSLRVIDAYQESIWGPRVRIADVERALMSLFQMPDQGRNSDSFDVHHVNYRKYIERVRMIVFCGSLTERLMGGDRMDIDAY
ncbi:uncharacterized protein FOMMEDRAFT_152625 [Fomitiporia mediterranea MF3/22]|uniref:uncharacterized protein n=1 Tax=Fomitiporia mediterranea (strain MF3/22) TaxID=694068 RepID=UPI0004408024|nr:uncharacterized protein FOMMEDRAFT_152625 [Fomitiporia mediterranea MF3/22]EJD05328.1 hypothetical protein FOMMEDRAFT_152625 [Fomitiporia mediterranea MF3/22]